MVSALILAGGSSRRMGEGKDKLMQVVAGKPLLVHAMDAFQECPDVEEVILVAREDRKESYLDLARKSGITKVTQVVSGGSERQDSVWSGLQALSAKAEIVLIHDGARSLVTPEIISRCVKAARQHGAIIPAARVKDTIKQASPITQEGLQQIGQTLDRSMLWAAQTPQTFRVELIRKAYEPLIRRREIVTDDAAAVERMGEKVWLLECDSTNLKVTTPEDLQAAESILSSRKKRN